MECPHCQSEITSKLHVFALGQDQDGFWQVSNTRCPMCDRIIATVGTKEGQSYPARPMNTTRARLADDIPTVYADDYHTACTVISFSQESAAAIGRRLLHRFLADTVHAGHGGLAEQIRRVSIAPELPPYIKQSLETLARIAKLDPESSKSRQPEVLVEPEPGEAEWLLDVLQNLFDFYYVRPARMQRKQDALEEKIAPPPPPEPEEAAQADADDAASSDAGADDSSPAADAAAAGTAAETPAALEPTSGTVSI